MRIASDVLLVYLAASTLLLAGVLVLRVRWWNTAFHVLTVGTVLGYALFAAYLVALRLIPERLEIPAPPWAEAVRLALYIWLSSSSTAALAAYARKVIALRRSRRAAQDMR